jgi:hypothetical protein
VKKNMSKSSLLIWGAASVLALATAAASASDTPAVTSSKSAAAAQASQSSADHPAPAQKAAPAKAGSKDAKGKLHPTRYQPDRFAGRAGKFYELTWGVDSLSTKLVESGELVRFSYRVIDPAKARMLNDKQSEASLIDPEAGVRLVVPTMEKVGQLRQSAPPEAGRSYWMTFSNKGRHVARGDRVDVVIGTFKANFLVVD